MTVNKKPLCFLCGLMLLFSVSCTQNQTEQIVKEHESAQELSEVCGLLPVDFAPENFRASAYRTVYDFVSETEYVSEEKIAVLRVADAEYSVSNLSGFTDTALFEVYTHTDGRVFEIETRENVFSCEWQDMFGEKSCNVSLVLINGAAEEFTHLLSQAISYFDGDNF